MPSLKIATWNINSVRLRAELVARFIKTYHPDLLCLQEIKCTEDQFPIDTLRAAGLPHIAIHGQKAYHGVATLSRFPFLSTDRLDFCKKGDARHLDTVIDVLGTPITLSNFYIPAGGDIPDPAQNEKFAHKLQFVDEFTAWSTMCAGHDNRIAVGDFNIAPLEHDVWSHKQLLKVVSHTPVETDGLKAALAAGNWIDLMREHIPEPEKLYTWWSYRAKDWSASDRGRRLDHVWVDRKLGSNSVSVEALREVRGWDGPSDHAPVIATFEL
ncbi:MAG: exodeoxyribonuclease III [Pseudomonadota bacterium]